MICKKHKKTFYKAPHKLFSGQGCPDCIEPSKGEKYISDVLNKNKIKYSKQFKNKLCKNIFELPFDFCVHLPNDKNLYIEYQGRQHYIFDPTIFGATNPKEARQNFDRGQANDLIKLNFCADNNIPLLVIPYTEFKNTETLLLNFIKQHTN